IRIAAAEWRIVLEQARRCSRLHDGEPQKVFIRSQRASFCALNLSEGYAVVLLLFPGSFSLSDRAFSAPVRDLCQEAGLPIPRTYKGPRWLRVGVRERREEGHRPEAIEYEGSWHELEVLGRYHSKDLNVRELG